MRLVVDSNVLFTFFWKGSVFSTVSQRESLELFSPEIALEEINKYSDEIKKKTGISSADFRKMREDLAMRVMFISERDYKHSLEDVIKLSKDFDENSGAEFLNDIDFYALALQKDIPIWTNDKLFKKQSVIPVLNTKEIILLLEHGEH